MAAATLSCPGGCFEVIYRGPDADLLNDLGPPQATIRGGGMATCPDCGTDIDVAWRDE